MSAHAIRAVATEFGLIVVNVIIRRRTRPSTARVAATATQPAEPGKQQSYHPLPPPPRPGTHCFLHLVHSPPAMIVAGATATIVGAGLLLRLQAVVPEARVLLPLPQPLLLAQEPRAGCSTSRRRARPGPACVAACAGTPKAKAPALAKQPARTAPRTASAAVRPAARTTLLGRPSRAPSRSPSTRPTSEAATTTASWTTLSSSPPLTGITNAKLVGAPTNAAFISLLVKQLEAMAAGRPIVLFGHNVWTFDFPLLYARACGAELDLHTALAGINVLGIMDTLWMVRKPGLVDFGGDRPATNKLGDCHEHQTGEKLSGAHGALVDSRGNCRFLARAGAGARLKLDGLNPASEEQVAALARSSAFERCLPLAVACVLLCSIDFLARCLACTRPGGRTERVLPPASARALPQAGPAHPHGDRGTHRRPWRAGQDYRWVCCGCEHCARRVEVKRFVCMFEYDCLPPHAGHD
eukprot:SAG22_NODE_411_length_10900_cov_2.633738_6_plen_468_part_00